MAILSLCNNIGFLAPAKAELRAEDKADQQNIIKPRVYAESVIFKILYKHADRHSSH